MRFLLLGLLVGLCAVSCGPPRDGLAFKEVSPGKRFVAEIHRDKGRIRFFVTGDNEKGFQLTSCPAMSTDVVWKDDVSLVIENDYIGTVMYKFVDGAWVKGDPLRAYSPKRDMYCRVSWVDLRARSAKIEIIATHPDGRSKKVIKEIFFKTANIYDVVSWSDDETFIVEVGTERFRCAKTNDWRLEKEAP